MTQPAPAQCPLQVRAQEVLANIRAVLELRVAQVPNAVAQVPDAVPQGPNAVAQGPNAVSAPAHVATPGNVDAGNNQNATVPELQLEVKQSVVFLFP